MTFEPKIVGILCNWCSYTGADLAGTSRIKYAPNVRVVRVMCSGRVDPTFILKAFADGADGVLVAGCHPGDCHYIEGNYKTIRRMALLKRMLAQYGIEPERFRLEWVSAGEGDRWAQVVNKITEDVRKLGPAKIKNSGLRVLDSWTARTPRPQVPRGHKHSTLKSEARMAKLSWHHIGRRPAEGAMSPSSTYTRKYSTLPRPRISSSGRLRWISSMRMSRQCRTATLM